MMNDRKKIEPCNLEPSKEYFLSDGTTSVLVTTDATASKLTLKPSLLLGLMATEKHQTFDLKYLMSRNFFSSLMAFYDTL